MFLRQVKELILDYCPGPAFWEASASDGHGHDDSVYSRFTEPLGITSLSVVICHWSVVPWRKLANLKYMHLDFGDLEEGEAETMRRIFANFNSNRAFLWRAGTLLPHLEAFSLRCYASMAGEGVEDGPAAVGTFLAALCHAAPKKVIHECAGGKPAGHSLIKLQRVAPRISGLANPHLSFVIASHGQMASFPAGATPFFLQSESARGVLYEKSPRFLDDAAAVPLFRGLRKLLI
jgi:hypothetical protein